MRVDGSGAVEAERAVSVTARRSAFARVRQGSGQLVHELALVPAIGLAILIGALVSDGFLTSDNMTNLLAQSAVLGVVVIAETLILLVGRFDLSLESIVGLAPMVVAWMIAATGAGGLGIGLDPLLAMALALAIGAAIGAINGTLVVKLQLNAFVVTLAMLILLRGVVLGISHGQTFFNLPPEFLYLGTATWIGLPASVWIVAGLFALATAFLRYHRIGRSIYAIGGNAAAARAAGIRVDRIIIGVYVVGGLLAAFAGLLLTARISAVTAGQGQNLIFTVFAAAVIGGISLEGGRGRMVGALSGVLLLGIIQNILTLSQVQSFWIDACFGAIILISLIISRVAGGRQDGDG
ncbi:MAG TPA: ABC transporter permease [Conexibacter sp.]|nr:ABC transporter permease [Conexibacter sp.]